MMKFHTTGSAPSREQLEKMIRKYYFTNEISLQKIEVQNPRLNKIPHYSVTDKNGKKIGSSCMVVIEKQNRWRFGRWQG